MMFLFLSKDLINQKNYDEVYKLLDFIFSDIETVSIKDGKEINLSKIEKEKALKRIEDLGETKVLKKYKAGKYIDI
jgi:ATP synthase F0, B subunit